MRLESLIFTLDNTCYDDDSGATLFLPALDIFSSASIAAANREGLEIVEGGLWFFDADGAPLQAKFSKEPYINSERNTYFPGVYSLHPGSGDTLQVMLSKIIKNHPSPNAWIVVYLASTDELALKNGWSSAVTMKDEVARALKILPPDILNRVKFEWGPAIARATGTKH